MSPPLGAHVSVAGGPSRAIERGERLGCDAVQIFVKNATQWRGKPLAQEEVRRFRRAHGESRIGPVVAHATYLINLAATDADKLRRSRVTLGDELDRCERLGVSCLVVHPGAHMGSGVDTGLARITESLIEVLGARPRAVTRLLLETTAGQGTLLGHNLDQLAAIRVDAGLDHRLGLCVDTCHVWAAGHALHEVAVYEDYFSEVRDRFGSQEPSCIHLNDSRHELGARRDRHANLGRGRIPLELFARLMHDDLLRDVPMILETPLGDDGEGHRRDLDLLRRL